jgi:hypothetical protein
MNWTRITLLVLASIAMLCFAGSARADDDDDDDCCAPVISCCQPAPCCDPCAGVGAVSYGGYSGAPMVYYGGGYRGWNGDRHYGHHRGRYYGRPVVAPSPYVAYYGY